ncbi:MAG: Calx-beta domain-containing protein, partial [bacterium]
MKNSPVFRYARGLMFATLIGVGIPHAQAADLFSTGPGQTPGDGMDDFWQAIYNAWGLSPAADTDSDGCTNVVESIAGTDPRKAGDCLRVGNTVVSASTVTFHFDSEGGKKYRVKSDGTLNGPFSTVENLKAINGVTQAGGVTEYVPPTDSPAGTPYNITVAKAPGTMRFYKLEVSDVDGDGDGLSSWAEVRTGLNPAVADSDGDGTNDGAEVAVELAVPNVVSIAATESQASEDGPQAGSFTVSRTHGLVAATVNFSLGGTATAPSDYASPGSSVAFAVGEKSKVIYVNPEADSALEGSESVTATLTTASAGIYAAPVIDADHDEATVIIGNTTAAAGTGLLARYYDHGNATYAHAANFGDAANYQYVRAGTTPNFTGTAVITPTGVSSTRLATLLAALTPNTTQVRFSFGGGNLNTVVYNNQNFLVTAKTAATFTIALPPGAGLPTNSTSTCHFSIQPIHPGLIERTEVVNNDWIYGTPNANTISHMNVPDNY